MNDLQRTRLRLKQDFLVMLAEMSHYEESLRIDEKATAPSIANLRVSVYPEWECIVDSHIHSIANRMSPKVGIPDFAYLSTL